MTRFLDDLRSAYPDDAIAVRKVGATTLVKLTRVPIPGRGNVTTDVLIEIADGSLERGERPGLFVRDGTTQPNGRPGRNVNASLVHGEVWLKFSWNFDWSASMPAWALVAGALRRFSINED